MTSDFWPKKTVDNRSLTENVDNRFLAEELVDNILLTENLHFEQIFEDPCFYLSRRSIEEIIEQTEATIVTKVAFY